MHAREFPVPEFGNAPVSLTASAVAYPSTPFDKLRDRAQGTGSASATPPSGGECLGCQMGQRVCFRQYGCGCRRYGMIGKFPSNIGKDGQQMYTFPPENTENDGPGKQTIKPDEHSDPTWELALRIRHIRTPYRGTFGVRGEIAGGRSAG